MMRVPTLSDLPDVCTEALREASKCEGFPKGAPCSHPPIRKGLCLIHFGRYCKALSEKLAAS